MYLSENEATLTPFFLEGFSMILVKMTYAVPHPLMEDSIIWGNQRRSF